MLAARSNAGPFRAVIFDLDGTLLDSEQLDLQALAEAAAEVLGRSYPREDLARFFGVSSEQTAAQLAGEKADALLSAWSRRYHALARGRLSLFPGVREALEVLHRQGLRLAVVTMQTRAELDFTRSILSLGDLVTCWIALDDTPNPKPDPQPVLAALRTLQADPGQAVMVGDAAADLRAGKAAGTAIAAALWGARQPDALLAFNPDFVFRSPEELKRLCDQGRET